MRCLIIAVCLLPSFTAIGDEEWGRPVELVDPAFLTNYPLGQSKSLPIMDETGRLWKIFEIAPGQRHFLATWEEDRWHPVDLAPPEFMNDIPIPLYCGPEGRAVFAWKDKGSSVVLTEVRGMRYRNAPPTPVLRTELRLYEDSRGAVWAELLPFYATHSALARPEELKRILTIRLPEMVGANGPHRPIPAFSDGKGHYGININDYELRLSDMGMLSGLLLLDVKSDWADFRPKHPRDARSPIPFTLLRKDGQIQFRTSSATMDPVQSFGRKMPACFVPKGDGSYLFASGTGVWEFDWGNFEHRAWLELEALQSPLSPEEIRFYQAKRIQLYPLGADWVLATDSGIFRLWPDKLTSLIRGLALPVSTEDGLWIVAEDADTDSGMAFVPKDGGELRWLGRPKGVSLQEAECIWQTPDGTLLIAGPHQVIALSPKEQRQILDTPTPEPDTYRYRLFSNTSGPIMMSDGRVCVFSSPPLEYGQISLWDGTTWKEWSTEALQWKTSGNEWALADDRNRIWLIRPKGFLDTLAWLLYDPATDEAQTGDSLLAALEDPALCPDRFWGHRREYRVPVLGADGSGVMVSYHDMYLRIDGHWQNPSLIIKRFSSAGVPEPEVRYERPPLDGPCYYDESGILCAEREGMVYLFSPDSGRFQYSPLHPPRHGGNRPDIAPPVVLFGGDEHLDSTRDTSIFSSSRFQYTSTIEDSLGIAWEWIEGRLIRKAYGLSNVELKDVDIEAFRRGIIVADITYDAQGGLFIHSKENELFHLRAMQAAPKTRVTAERLPGGMVRLHFESGSGLRHAWRNGFAPWQHSSDLEVLAGPFPPGQHLLEVYAFDDRLNVDPAPKRLPIEVSIDSTPEALLVYFVEGDEARRLWARDRLKEHGEAGMDAVKKALEREENERIRWRLEALLQQLTGQS